MHPIDTDLLALLHAEPVWLGAEAARRHIDACPLCTRRAESLRREETEQRTRLLQLGFPLPPVTAAMIVRRATVRRRNFRLAASIGALATLASAAMALPGSPMRAWMRASFLAPVAIARVSPAGSSPAAQPAATGIEFRAAGTLVIELRVPQASGQIRIIRSDSAIAVARAIGGAVRFRVGSGRLMLDNRVAADRYEFSLPRNLTQMSVLVGGRLLVRLTSRDAAPRTDTLTFDLSLHPGGVP